MKSTALRRAQAGFTLKAYDVLIQRVDPQRPTLVRHMQFDRGADAAQCEALDELHRGGVLLVHQLVDRHRRQLHGDRQLLRHQLQQRRIRPGAKAPNARRLPSLKARATKPATATG